MRKLFGWVVLLAAACGSRSSGLPSDGVDAGADVAESPCASIEQQLLDMVKDHQSCSKTSDCQSVALYCLLKDRPSCSGDFYVNQSADIQGMEALHAQLQSCVYERDPEPQCGGCLIYNVPACVGGKCVPAPPTTPGCPICANESFVCFGPQPESVDFVVEQPSALGCSGHIVQAGTPTTELMLQCDPPTVCSKSSGCTPATFTDTTFEWGSTKCVAN